MRKPGCGARKSDSGVCVLCHYSVLPFKEIRRGEEERDKPSKQVGCTHKGTEVGLCWMANHIFPLFAGKKRNHGYGFTGLENF